VAPASDSPSGSPIRKRLLDQIPDEVPDRESAAIAAFAQAYVRRIPDEEMPSIPPEELFAEIHDVFHFVDRRGFEPVALRVFNPDPEVDGYHASGTVVEVVADDGPFLVDSVSNALAGRELGVARHFHPVIGAVRDDDGRLIDVIHARNAERCESVQHVELEQRLEDAGLDELDADLRKVVGDVQLAVRDFEQMRAVVHRMTEMARAGAARYEQSEVDEAIAFLEWLLDLNFVFLGYREYRIEQGPEGPAIGIDPGSGLGILTSTDDSRFADPVPLSELPDDLRARYEEGHLLVVTKTNRPSTVHRGAKMDYIGLRTIGSDGAVVGEARLVGLFTSKAYMTEAASIPILRRKLESILEAEDLIEGSHDYKLVVQLFESFPKEDLFAAPISDLRQDLMGLLETEEHERVRLFIRRDLLRRSVSVLVTVPRDRFNATLRKRLQGLFRERYETTTVDYRLALGETGDARIHFTVWLEGPVPMVSFDELEADVLALARTWEDRLREALSVTVGSDSARSLAERWSERFPEYYRISTPLELVAGDVVALDRLSRDGARLSVGLQNETAADERLTRIAVYRLDGKLDLSAMLPLLEDLGLRVVEEVPTRLLGDDGEVFIHDFGVLGPDGRQLSIERCGARVAATLTAALDGETESDSLHRLIVTSDLDYEQIEIVRAYRTYWRLVTPSFSLRYINDAFAENPGIAANLIRLFVARFGPEAEEATQATLRAEILHDLDAVASLDQDRILRGFAGLIEATMRTNAYLPERSCLSFKLRSALVPDMPEPKPMFEIFVYAPHVEGVHLRGSRIARGGIRWSTRREDYRTEVLGLMKAQMTKNAVIVPSGAKGGFVVRGSDQDPAAVRAAYQTFVRGLLDVTDNRVSGEIVPPVGVPVHDDPDPYLVVAADRGTAALSDLANAIAAEYDFWLGDAFASGGSAGYDHKALGITARGAWESVRRHFLELGVDVDEAPISVVGIGDMSGDVFGNGMLLSPHLRLVAAFDHRHVFIDPNPDPEVSYAERRRLFETPGSSWDDYDRVLLSEGGGVWPRSAKRIELSDQAREALGIEPQVMTPSEAIQAVLRAPVDLLWNGGVGTYVKAATESHEAAQDRVNDPVRVDGRDVRARVVGEGGNLGFTQEGRIEYEEFGGRSFTDFIDNSGGVHCSDREVNLKILLGLAVEREGLDMEERDRIVAGVADDVVAAIVYDNFLQAQILSQAVDRSAGRIDAYEDLMEQLEDEGLLDRVIEGLPAADEMIERAREGRGMARAELATLLAYAKRSLTDALLAGDLPDSPHFEQDLATYFPAPVVSRFGWLIMDHPLRRELVATIVANQVLNSEGITFVSRLESETGASSGDVVEAYRVARRVTGAGERWRAIEALAGDLDPTVVRQLMAGVDQLVETVTRWYLARSDDRSVEDQIGLAGAAFGELALEIASVGPEEWRAERDAEADDLVELGAPPGVAQRHVYQAELVYAPDIIELAALSDRSVLEVARVFFRVGAAFRLDWLEEQVAQLPTATRWQRWAVQTLQDDLLLLRRQLAERVLEGAVGREADAAVDAYLVSHAHGEGRLIRLMRLLVRDGVSDTAAAIVAIRQIRALVG
jgi:glutamate dehydrogenase